MITQKQLAKIFNKDVHFISKFLKSCGLKDNNNKPIKSWQDKGLARFDKVWLWDESVITVLEKKGLTKLRKYTEKHTKNGVFAYTDGGKGSYAAVLNHNGKHYIAGKSSDLLDNNRAELYAVKALFEIIEKLSITIYTDSKYVIHALKIPQLQEKNLDILTDIAILAKTKRIKYKCIWIKGHVGILGNEEADALCRIVKQIDNI